MIAIIDYDAGNIRSVEKAAAFLGQEACLTRDPEVLLSADKLILPGVGAFGDAMGRLEAYGLIEVIRKACGKGVPFLGICLGLQLLFEESEESPGIKGLGLLKGRIRRLPVKDGLKVPDIGWNSLSLPRESRLFTGIEQGDFVYFVHSYYLKAKDPGIVTAQIDYGVTVDAAVEEGNLFGCQFHPEKSSRVGLAILKNFLELA